ncbi:MAG: restriction endonuclease [Massilibacteroides sp.]|nr:restriction endonuclease [Massilibacteroides sp.]
MNNIEKAQQFLKDLETPIKQQTELCAYALLAMSNIKSCDKWNSATNNWVRVHDIISFIGKEYNKLYAENSRETFRKQAIHHFRTAAFIEDNGNATNSPNYRYRLTDEFLAIFCTYNGKKSVSSFLKNHESLINIYASKKKMKQIPIKVNGLDLVFSVGKHNELQKAIIEQFGPRFAPGAECLYVGDTTKKDLVKNESKLRELGFEITLHEKMPDVVLYSKENEWIYFIESVTSVGPMDSKRIIEISEMTKNVTCGKIFITAFLNFKTYKKFAESLAWETEVWLAEMPEHMIHLNGDKFMGPRKEY